MSGRRGSGTVFGFLAKIRSARGPFVLCLSLLVCGWSHAATAADADVLRPRVPPDEIARSRAAHNPLPTTPENIEAGKVLYHGKAFCVTCHGRDGRGLQDIPGLRGSLPRDFTDKVWQATRTDGELFWVLKNGSPGTDMASFVPLVLTEEEAWQVLLYVRSFNTR